MINYQNYIAEATKIGNLYRTVFDLIRIKNPKNKYGSNLTVNPQIVSSFDEYFDEDEIELIYDKIQKDKKLMKYADMYFRNGDVPLNADTYIRKKLSPKEIKKLESIGSKLSQEGFFPDEWQFQNRGVLSFAQPRPIG